MEDSYFRFAVCRSGNKIDRHFLDSKAALECLDREFGLDFKAASEQRNVFDKAAIESAVPGQNVRQFRPEDQPKQRRKEIIAESIEQPELAVGSGMQSRADDHVRSFVYNGLDQPAHRMSRIGAVA